MNFLDGMLPGAAEFSASALLGDMDAQGRSSPALDVPWRLIFSLFIIHPVSPPLFLLLLLLLRLLLLPSAGSQCAGDGRSWGPERLRGLVILRLPSRPFLIFRPAGTDRRPQLVAVACIRA
ncbi:unnamed protein product [Prorocentrum cordatum]|uniref:Uncharacterized protein n=1 Tax=Prorocentrum cordatum TaxID=2364126 RepID=A0ABN9WEN9_9DINO|nr:unnamed protein product [Polarella glacialis]